MKRWQLAILWSVVGVLVWLVLKWASQPLLELFAEPQGALASQLRQVGGSTESGLAITGWVDQNRAHRREPFSVFYRLTNLGKDPIGDLQVTLHAPGFVPIRAAGVRPSQIAVHPLDGQPIAALLPKVTRTFRADVEAAAASGDYMITAAFEWTSPGGQIRAETMELGPLRLRSRRLELTASIRDFVIQLGPLVLPLLVAGFGFWFQVRNQRYVQERQAWAAMLPVSHANNTQLYLPLLSDIHSFRSRFDRYRQDPANPVARDCFFYLILSLRKMREVSDKGGFYLKSREGEDIVADLWGEFLNRVRTHLVRDGPVVDVGPVVDAVEPTDTFSTFRRKQRAYMLRRRVRGVEAAFREWATHDQERKEFQILFLFYDLLKFEMNRIYAFWYGHEGDFPHAACEKKLPDLEALGGTAAEQAVRLLSYSRRFQPYWRRILLSFTRGWKAVAAASRLGRGKP